MQGRGEAAITVYYLSRVAAARVGVAFEKPVSAETYNGFKTENYIDQLVLKKLKALHIAPAAPASDAEFLRRAYLDTIGTLPTADEVTRFSTRLPSRQEGATGRRAAGSARVHRLLGLQVVRYPAGLESQTAAPEHARLLSVHP